MNAKLKTLYRNATDFITYVKLDAPDFASEDRMTCERAFARIRQYLDDIGNLEKSEIALAWLKLSAQGVTRAEKFFLEQKNSDGRKTLDASRAYLTNAAVRKPIEAKFIAGESGAAQDTESGFSA